MLIQEAADKWLDELQHNRAELTAKTYRTGVRHLCDYLQEQGKAQVKEIAPLDVMGCVRWLQDRDDPIKRSSLFSYITPMSQFLKFLARKRMVVFAPEDFADLEYELLELRKRGLPKRHPKLPDETELEQIRNVAEHRHGSTERLELFELRNLAMLETLCSTGARIAEIAGMKRNDLIPERKAAQVIGKKDKQRLVYFTDTAWAALQAYLTARDKADLDGRGNGEPLFSRHDRNSKGMLAHMSTNSFRDALSLMCRRASAEHIWPHLLRHRMATRLLKSTGDLATTQKALGHADPSTTISYYAVIADETVQEAHEKTDL